VTALGGDKAAVNQWIAAEGARLRNNVNVDAPYMHTYTMRS